MATQVVPGLYYTDGKRLVQVIGQTKEGECLVEDVVSEVTMAFQAAEFDEGGVWRVVKHGPV